MNNQPNAPQAQKYIHWLSFKKLPPEVQQRLLNLQNGEGDYIKRKAAGSGCFVAVVVFLIFAWLFVFSVSLQMIPLGGFWIIFAATFLVFLICSWFLIQIIKDARIPLKSHTFITPTQIIMTNGDVIQIANLASVENITHVITRNNKGGRFSNLELKFPDRSILKFSIKGDSEAHDLTNKINGWNNYYRSISSQDQTYFQRLNILQGVPLNDFPLYTYKNGCLGQMLIGGAASLLLTTLIVTPLAVLMWYRADKNDWEQIALAKEKNLGTYKNYLQKHPYGQHRQEAQEQFNSLYGEITNRYKTKSGADSAASEALLSLMEQSKDKDLVHITQFYERENKISADAEQKLNAKLTKQTIIPLTGNLTDSSLTTIQKDLSLRLAGRFKNTFPERILVLDDFNEYTKTTPADAPLLKIKYTVEVDETSKPTLTANTSGKEKVLYPEMTVNFDCSLINPGKPPYQFNYKSVPTPDFSIYSKTDSSFYQQLLKKAFADFDKEFARRFGLKEPEKAK
jgi:hypothetical protein